MAFSKAILWAWNPLSEAKQSSRLVSNSEVSEGEVCTREKLPIFLPVWKIGNVLFPFRTCSHWILGYERDNDFYCLFMRNKGGSFRRFIRQIESCCNNGNHDQHGQYMARAWHWRRKTKERKRTEWGKSLSKKRMGYLFLTTNNSKSASKNLFIMTSD